MNNVKSPKRQGCLALLGIMGIVFLSNYVYHKVRESRYTAALYAIAEQFGYTSAGQITQTLKCRDFTFFLEADCGTFVMFRTNLNHDDLRSTIERTGLRVDPWDPSSSSLNTLFTDIRFQTDKTLTWVENDRSDHFSIQQEILTVTWYVEDQQGREVYINFFETSALHGNLALDGQPLLDNIISIEINLGLLPVWAQIE